MLSEIGYRGYGPTYNYNVLYDILYGECATLQVNLSVCDGQKTSIMNLFWLMSIPLILDSCALLNFPMVSPCYTYKLILLFSI